MLAMCPSAAARLPTRHKVGKMHRQEEVCPKDEEFYVMGIHLKHKKLHSFLYPMYISHIWEYSYGNACFSDTEQNLGIYKN